MATTTGGAGALNKQEAKWFKANLAKVLEAEDGMKVARRVLDVDEAKVHQLAQPSTYVSREAYTRLRNYLGEAEQTLEPGDLSDQELDRLRAALDRLSEAQGLLEETGLAERTGELIRMVDARVEGALEYAEGRPDAINSSRRRSRTFTLVRRTAA